MKLNEKGQELWKVWLDKWKKEIEYRESIGDIESGTCILEDYVKTITDKCGFLLLTYPYMKGMAKCDRAFEVVVTDWKWNSNENKNTLCWKSLNFTKGEVVEELKKYLIFEDEDYYLCEEYGIERW